MPGSARYRRPPIAPHLRSQFSRPTVEVARALGPGLAAGPPLTSPASIHRPALPGSEKRRSFGVLRSTELCRSCRRTSREARRPRCSSCRPPAWRRNREASRHTGGRSCRTGSPPHRTRNMTGRTHRISRPGGRKRREAESTVWAWVGWPADPGKEEGAEIHQAPRR